MGRWHYSRLRHALYAAWQVNDKRLANHCHSSAFIRFPAWETWKSHHCHRTWLAFFANNEWICPALNRRWETEQAVGYKKYIRLCDVSVSVYVCVCLCTGIGWNLNSFIGFVHRYCIPVPSCSYPSYPGKNAVGLDLTQVREDTEYETLPSWCEPLCHCLTEVILLNPERQEKHQHNESHENTTPGGPGI